MSTVMCADHVVLMRMKKEFSAGGVIACYRTHGWEVLLLKDASNNWSFPKGLVEKGETLEAGAAREIAEEVGLKNIELVEKLTPITYFFKRNELIHKTVQHFLYTTKGTETIVVQKEEGIQQAKWVPIDKALEIVGYPKTNKLLLEESKKILQKTYGT